MRASCPHERWAGPGYGNTLGQALVSEGLAGQFARQLYGNEPEHYERAIDADATRELARVADALWDEPAYDHARWFFGSGDLPVHAGYTLGYALVGAHLAAHAKESAATLAHEAAGAFRSALAELGRLRSS